MKRDNHFKTKPRTFEFEFNKAPNPFKVQPHWIKPNKYISTPLGKKILNLNEGYYVEDQHGYVFTNDTVVVSDRYGSEATYRVLMTFLRGTGANIVSVFKQSNAVEITNRYSISDDHFLQDSNTMNNTRIFIKYEIFMPTTMRVLYEPTGEFPYVHLVDAAEDKFVRLVAEMDLPPAFDEGIINTIVRNVSVDHLNIVIPDRLSDSAIYNGQKRIWTVR